MASHLRPSIKLLGALACVGVLSVLWRFTPLREVVTAGAVRHWAETFGRQPWAPLAILLAYTPASVIMFPRPLITLAATVAFGPWLGSLYALGGIELAALSGYFAGRGVSPHRLRRVCGRRLNALSARLRSGGLSATVLVRLLPVAPFVVVSLFAGAARVGLTAFALGTAIGMAPGLIGMTVFGSQLGRALGGKGPVNVWLIAAVFALTAAILVLARRFALRGGQAAPGGPGTCIATACTGRIKSTPVMIRKLPSGKYRLYSRKPDPRTGKRRNLGTFATRSAAQKHERAVQYFKRRG